MYIYYMCIYIYTYIYIYIYICIYICIVGGTRFSPCSLSSKRPRRGKPGNNHPGEPFHHARTICSPTQTPILTGYV